jgi:hypothetical protein
MDFNGGILERNILIVIQIMMDKVLINYNQLLIVLNKKTNKTIEE